MKLGAQQAVILELVRMQQRDLLRRGVHLEPIAGHEFTQQGAIAGDLRARVGAIDEFSRSITERPDTTMGRSDSVCGQMGATTSTSRCGATMGPPQDSA